jgi:hypothetical protein
MQTATRLPPGISVFVTLRGKTILAEVVGYKESPKGLFYVTRDNAGVERKVRQAYVSIDRPPPPSPAGAATDPSPGVGVGVVSPPPANVTTRQPRAVPRPSAVRAMPDWPRGMAAPLAAAYCGISESLLERQGIKATRISAGRKVYLREHLDAWLDAKDGRAPAAAPDDFDMDEGFAIDACFRKLRAKNSRVTSKPKG